MSSTTDREARRADREAFRAEAARRKSICITCPHVGMVLNRPIYCGMCGCPLVSKTKVRGEQCPDNKWFPYQPGAVK